MTYLEFVRGQLGTNWVVARRTSRILARYGEDVVCISQQRMRAIDKEYRTLYGDPNDKVRAQMYLALVAARQHFEENCDDVSYSHECAAQLDAAIKAEQNRS